MIALLRGRVLALGDEDAIIDVGGVGYRVFCHLRTLATLHEHRGVETEATLHVHTAVSDDDIRLFGFPSRDELRLFRLLIGVERIGPKAALSILGRAELPTLVRAVRGGEVALLSSVPGIGRKTAERVILELRDKLDGLALPGAATRSRDGESAAVASAVEGLVGLGFRESEARAAVADAVAGVGEEPEVAALVSAALRQLDTAAGPPVTPRRAVRTVGSAAR